MMDPSSQTIQFLHGVPVPLEIVQGQIFDTDTGVEITLDNNEEQEVNSISIKDESIEETAEEVSEDYVVNDNSENDGESSDETEGQITYTYSNGEIVEAVPASLSHHDYIATVQPQQINSKQELTEFQVPMDMAHNGGLEITNQGTFQVPVEMQNELVIEEAPETEVIAQSAEDEEMVRSKPLTALYLQRKEINLSDHQALRINPFKSPPSSSTFQGKSSTSLSYDSPSSSYNGSQSDDDINRMRISYGNSCFYNLSTGELQLKIDPEEMEGKLKLNPERSVGAILAASEAIKHQDIASEVEIGTYEDVSPPKQKGRKKKNADKGGIDEDIEKIKKAAKNVAFTLKGMKEKSGRKRRKPRIRLTLTKAKGKKNQPAYTDEEEDEEEEERDNEALYESIAETPAKRKRKTTYNTEQPNIIYQCEYCEKQFKTREKVRCHTRIHTEDRNFHCEICGQAYRRREHLVRHYRNHTNDRPYQCVLCGKSYMRAEHLKRHSYFHSGEKPFECAVCDKAFARHDRLIKHSLVHDN